MLTDTATPAREALELQQVDRPSSALAAVPQAAPITVIEHAMRAGATPDQLERLLDLQVRADNHQLELMREKRRMDKEDRVDAAQRAFDAAMTKLRGHNIIVPKTKAVKQLKKDGTAGPSFKQSEFDIVVGLLSPKLSECGLSFRHDQRFGSKRWMTEGVENELPWVFVTCFLTHEAGHCERLDLDGPQWDSGAMNELQRMQSTASFLKRQGLLAITGTPTAEEDDETRRTGGGKGPTAEQPALAEDAALLQAGRDASMTGMKALSGWWGRLTEAQRGRLTPEFGEMRKAARKADESGAAK